MATSALNPNAPIFVPFAYRAVEDFSDQWYDLVHSTPWFRDYWLQERFLDPEKDASPFDDDFAESALPDVDFIFGDDNNDVVHDNSSAAIKHDGEGKLDLISMGLLKWRKPREAINLTKYGEKAPKIVNVRVNPRPIKQPR
ncbi:hypothetical protein M9H77_10785 [Catharanthus roseus]|uniref:Uncharacterized protein n=1 Tax=Catharanthus roseus TaxID=4058 RepID=A0ACC0BCR1_CATRO|nr:hypothetical protein M9H77_10785 [Catharanthus roseus]